MVPHVREEADHPDATRHSRCAVPLVIGYGIFHLCVASPVGPTASDATRQSEKRRARG